MEDGNILELKQSPLYLFFKLWIGGRQSIKLDLQNNTLSTSNYDKLMDLSTFEKYTCHEGVFFSSISLKHSGQNIILNGFPKNPFRKLFLTAVQTSGKFFEQKYCEEVKRLETEWNYLLDLNFYFSNYKFVAWANKVHAIPFTNNFELLDRKSFPSINIYIGLIKNISKNDQIRLTYNNSFVESEANKFSNYFDNIEKKPLTDQQRRAVIVNEDNNLVIASAGSGKTSTILARAGYLIKKGLCKEDQILILSFSNKSSQELKERIKNKTNLNINVSTFHSFGLSTIARAEGRKPSLNPIISDPIKLNEFGSRIVSNLSKTNKSFMEYLFFFQAFFNIKVKTILDFTSKIDYEEYIRENNLQTLNGELVKSFEELTIANFLFLNGIEYKYETEYEFETANKDRVQYRPDFYLIEPGIYLEHFGIDRANNTAPYINNETYLKQIEWKRKCHLEHGTKLIETYSYMFKEGTIIEYLYELIDNYKIKRNRKSINQGLDNLRNISTTDNLTELMVTFHTLFKEGGYSHDKLLQEIEKEKDYFERERNKLFVKMHRIFYSEYEKELGSTVDFSDLIVNSVSYIDSGKVVYDFKHILVDEFQDIAPSRAKLLLALKKQIPDCTLYCVGDDWQSIYRFTGSDISFFTGFEKYFGSTAVTKLEKTFRFNDKLVKFSSNFILQNKSQIRKNVEPAFILPEPAVEINFYSTELNSKESENSIVNEILIKLSKVLRSEKTIMILARYHHNLINISKFLSNKAYKHLKVIPPVTCHQSKGLEADYVIILNLDQSETHGFPSNIADDRLLHLVLSNDDTYEHAEERRLFYVAMTRARNKVFLLAPRENPSIFINEIMRKKHGYEYKLSSDTQLCASCESGIIFKRKTKNGFLWVCTNQEECNDKVINCPYCSKGAAILKNGVFVCLSCDKHTKKCPQCSTGYLIIKNGKHGEFWGCTNYNKLNHCSYSVSKTKV